MIRLSFRRLILREVYELEAGLRYSERPNRNELDESSPVYNTLKAFGAHEFAYYTNLLNRYKPEDEPSFIPNRIVLRKTVNHTKTKPDHTWHYDPAGPEPESYEQVSAFMTIPLIGEGTPYIATKYRSLDASKATSLFRGKPDSKRVQTTKKHHALLARANYKDPKTGRYLGIYHGFASGNAALGTRFILVLFWSPKNKV